MRGRFLCVVLTICSLTVSACSKEVPVETEPPMPEYLDVTNVTLDTYGDNITFAVNGSEAIQSVTDTQVVILPDRTRFDMVTVEYIQGNSLNDFPQAYHDGLSGTDVTDLVDGKFTTSTQCYGFVTTVKNNYLLFKASLDKANYVSALMERFGE